MTKNNLRTDQYLLAEQEKVEPAEKTKKKNAAVDGVKLNYQYPGSLQWKSPTKQNEETPAEQADKNR